MSGMEIEMEGSTSSWEDTEDTRFIEDTRVRPSNKKQSVWSKPFIALIALQFLMLLLLLTVLCLILVHMSSKNTMPARITENKIGSPNFTEMADSIVSSVNTGIQQNIPDLATAIAQNTCQLLQSYPNFTEIEEQILQTTRDSAEKLINIVNTLSALQDTSTSTAGVADDILLVVQKLMQIHNNSNTPLKSCEEIKKVKPNSPSGVYLLANATSAYTAYCNMEELCGLSGGWTRLAYLDMSSATQSCPSGFRLYQSGGVRACGRPATNSGSCVSVQFPSNGISYSQVCGRVVGYQYGSTDAVSETVNNLNSYYLDGVSITRGSPRQHVWSLFAGVWSDYTDSNNSCPCAGGTSPQSFVGNNYFCESGNRGRYISLFLFTSDPLWDGQGCYSLEASCCTVPNIPWFYRNYNSTKTTDYLELRVCGDEGTSNDDAPVSMYEIYVK